MQVNLNEKAAKKLSDLRESTRERGLKKATWDELISELILKQNEKSWQSLIDKFTKDDFFINEALSDQKSKKAIMDLIQKLKKTNTKQNET